MSHITDAGYIAYGFIVAITVVVIRLSGWISFYVPKSSTLTVPLSLGTRMFDGFRSRCTIRFWCA